jgi:hypothetical protein
MKQGAGGEGVRQGGGPRGMSAHTLHAHHWRCNSAPSHLRHGERWTCLLEPKQVMLAEVKHHVDRPLGVVVLVDCARVCVCVGRAGEWGLAHHGVSVAYASGWPLSRTAFQPLWALQVRHSLSDRTISLRLTMLGCERPDRILISRIEVMGKPSFSVSMRILLSATRV